MAHELTHSPHVTKRPPQILDPRVNLYPLIEGEIGDSQNEFTLF